jgi:hypothetical protein
MMKRKFAIVVPLVAVALALSSGPARAQSANAAVVIRDGVCGVLDATCSISAVFFIVDNGASAVATSSGNGKSSCQATLPSGAVLPTNGAIQCENFPCNTTSGVTTDSMETISPSGQVNLQCFVH